MGWRSQRAMLRDDAARLLGELGGTAGEVACTLYLVGASAPGTAARQPSAPRYLHAIMGGDPRVEHVTVTGRSVIIKTHRRWHPTIRVRLPRPVRQFTETVDRPRPLPTVILSLDDEQS